ncbi:carbohydrate sulfotransferase 11-like [Babylonia areolata]|uniref:carbohydrate sulfotransferase 11-like n=1 Tax=Babylonia areolata TaxID=304850 RepID=UPI003FD38954
MKCKTFFWVTAGLLFLWVFCVVLFVTVGQMPVFDTELRLNKLYDDSHLVVMRELKEEGGVKTGTVASNKSKTMVVAASVAKAERPPEMTAVQREIADRVSTMNQWCQRLHPHEVDVAALPAAKFSKVLVDRTHRLVLCEIPGVAQNDWRRIFLYLTGKVNVSSHLKISAYDAHSKHAHLLKKLSDFKPQERKAILEQSLKVLFVREPLERLVSTYQNKFQARYSKYFHESFGRKIVQRYRRNATAAAKKSGNDVRFPEFVRFVLDAEHESTDDLLNEHWERYYKQCHPCMMGYDFVGKFESLVDDTKEVLTRSKTLGKLKPPYVADTFRNSEKSLNGFFKDVPQSDLKRLWNMYYPDYNLFSYPYPEVLHTLLRKNYHDY